MYLLYCDETNLEEKSGDFLIYGGLAIDGSKALSLSKKIDEIRREYNVSDDYKLKFNPGPEGMDHNNFIDFKRSVIQAAVEHEVCFLVYLILHDVATDPDVARRNGINTMCQHFDAFLHRRSDAGLILIDRFQDSGKKIDAHLTRKFSVGLEGLPYKAVMRLENIVGLHYSAIGQSHFPSLVDVVLGSFRYAINIHTRGMEKHISTAQNILNTLSPLFFREDGSQSVSELGLMFSPKIIKVNSYKSKYESLKSFLSDSGIITDQPITSERQY